MKQNDMLILGAAGILAYYLYTKKQAAAQGQETGGGLGNLFNLPGVDLSGLGGFFDSIWNSLNSLFKSGPQNIQQSIAAQNAAAANKRWTTQAPYTPSTLGFTNYGVYSPAALQANPTLLPAGANMGQQVAQLSAYTGPTAAISGGPLPGQTGPASVGTVYSSSGQAAPALFVPTANYGGKGQDIYTTLDVAIGQKAAAAGAKTAPTAATLAQMYSTGRI